MFTQCLLTAFLVVVARQKQGGRASDRAAASAAPESESAPETEGAAVHQILLRGGGQNRLLKNSPLPTQSLRTQI